MKTRLFERCQNPSCPHEGGRPLDDVTPPLRADAKYCSDQCSRSVRDKARRGLEGHEAAQRFWNAVRAATGRATPASSRLRARHRAAVS